MLLEIASLRVKWLALCSSGSFLISTVKYYWYLFYMKNTLLKRPVLLGFKLYFRLMNLILIHIGVVFFSFSSQLVSLLPIVLIWFLFELILSYFGSDNWIWIINLKLKTIVIKKKRKEIYQIGPVWSTLVYPVYFGPFRSIQSTLFTSVQFGPLRFIMVQFSLLRSIQPIWYI